MSVSALVFALTGCHHQPTPEIRLNQVGFAPLQEKTALIDVEDADTPPCEVIIVNAAGDTAWRGVASATMLNPVSGMDKGLRVILIILTWLSARRQMVSFCMPVLLEMAR